MPFKMEIYHQKKPQNKNHYYYKLIYPGNITQVDWSLKIHQISILYSPELALSENRELVWGGLLVSDFNEDKNIAVLKKITQSVPIITFTTAHYPHVNSAIELAFRKILEHIFMLDSDKLVLRLEYATHHILFACIFEFVSKCKFAYHIKLIIDSFDCNSLIFDIISKHITGSTLPAGLTIRFKGGLKEDTPQLLNLILNSKQLNTVQFKFEFEDGLASNELLDNINKMIREIDRLSKQATSLKESCMRRHFLLFKTNVNLPEELNFRALRTRI